MTATVQTWLKESDEFSRVYENEFQGTSVSVVIVKVRK
jgi:hypothetical protein